MRNLTRILFALIVSCFLSGHLHAAMADPNVVVKGMVFDNDTNGPLTTATTHIGVRILVTNNSTNTVSLNNMHFGGIGLTSLSLAAPSAQNPAPSDTGVLWANGGFKIDNTFGSPSLTLDPHYTQMVGIAILPVAQGYMVPQQFSPTNTFTYIKNLPKGMYLPQMHFVATDAHGIVTYYGVQNEPVTINS